MQKLFGDRAQILCLGFWLLALLPAINQLAGVYLLLCIAPVALHQRMRQQKTLRWLLIAVTLIIAISWTALSGQRWLSSNTVISLLAIVLLLKWAESDTARELKISALASMILATLSSLYLSGLSALVYLIFNGVLLLICLLTINDAERQLSYKQLLKMTLNLTVLALPVTIVLFVTVPRIQGPLWDIGLAIGLPIELAIDQDARDIGLKATLKAGQVSRLKRSDAPVLVAEFTGAIPSKSLLYWRGPVFTYFDGTRWQLEAGWNNRSRLLSKAFRGKEAVDQVLTTKRHKVHYEARVSAHNARWLYALDVPTGRTPEAFISEHFQLLGIRKIDREFKYDVSAWLDYRGGRSLTREEHLSYLQHPENSNRRLKEFGIQLAKEHSNSEDTIHALRKYLAAGSYKIGQTTDISEHPDNLDEFFFERKNGTIEHLAGSTALVLRAAGIPTRLITGYRGGSLIALTNFIVVKQEHAHVWLETWSPTSGWQRLEAIDFVTNTPPEKASLPAKPQPKVKPAEKKTAVSNASVSKQPVATKAGAQNKEKKKKEQKGNWLDSLSSGFETWVLNYNPDRQVELMKKSGLRQVDWKSLAALALLGLLLLTMIYGLFLQFGRHKRDPVCKSFEQLNQRMQKLQLACGEQECPSLWLQRIVKTHPPYYPALKQVVDQYLRLRYISNSQPQTEHIKQFQRDVKRLIAML